MTTDNDKEPSSGQLKSSSLGRVFLLIGLAWTIIIASIAFWDVGSEDQHIEVATLSEARSFFDLIITSRIWNASHGGVYVLITSDNPPNPYLDIPDRDITTTDGRQLTMINPAYMTRQLSEIAAARNRVQFRITSLDPIRPENTPMPWEESAMKGFSSPGEELYKWSKADTGEQIFQYIAPLITELACLKCHAKQGYEEGDLRGAISITIPVTERMSMLELEIYRNTLIYFTVWFLGCIALLISHKFIRTEQLRRESALRELSVAREEVKILRGFISICSNCKKVRNDEGSWGMIEQYIREHSEAEFTHGICPECAQELYPEHNPYKNNSS